MESGILSMECNGPPIAVEFPPTTGGMPGGMPVEFNNIVPEARMPQANQHKPLPPAEELERYITHYWKLRMSDQAIAEHVLKHFEPGKFGLSGGSVKRLRKRYNLRGTRQQGHTVQSIRPFVERMRSEYGEMGARAMVKTFMQDYNMKVSEKVLLDFLKVERAQQTDLTSATSTSAAQIGLRAGEEPVASRLRLRTPPPGLHPNIG